MIFCMYCHFKAEYNHYHLIFVIRTINDMPVRIAKRIFDGNFVDDSKVCLPCQISWRQNPL